MMRTQTHTTIASMDRRTMSRFPFHVLVVMMMISSFLFAKPMRARSVKRQKSSRITVVGAVYCDTCSSNAFTRNSYFLPGVDVEIRCTFRENSGKSREQFKYSVNRTTDRFGVYKLEIPSVDGVNCLTGISMVSMCQATLAGAAAPGCEVPSLRTTSDEISIKSEQDNLCIYSLNALSYKPLKRNTTLCGNKRQEMANALESSKCFFPFPNWPNLPSFDFPPFPSLPWPFQFPPFPFPFPSLAPSPPPAFSLWDPRTWIPSSPPSPPDLSRAQNP